jgi:phosphoglycolate phosphatase-like HAD superfamily hydrolase
MEEWRDIPGWEGLYQASDHGNVRRIVRFRKVGRGLFEPSEFRPVKLGTDSRNGYRTARLSHSSSAKTLLVHRLVCAAFHGLSQSGRNHVAHFDGSRDNNRADNLRWASPKENAADRRRHDRDMPGERHVLSKLSAEQVKLIRAAHGPRGSGVRLAREYGVTPTLISRIVRRRTWKHV